MKNKKKGWSELNRYYPKELTQEELKQTELANLKAGYKVYHK